MICKKKKQGPLLYFDWMDGDYLKKNNFDYLFSIQVPTGREGITVVKDIYCKFGLLYEVCKYTEQLSAYGNSHKKFFKEVRNQVALKLKDYLELNPYFYTHDMHVLEDC